MLIPRKYEPNEEEILYHYCSASTFHAICTNKKIRLSDLFSMNDYMEVHWGYSIWEQVKNELLSELGNSFLDTIDEIISMSSLQGLLVASCFSLDGDVLSQWRAYADDGKGYAIGFGANNLIKLPVNPLRVLYDQRQQIEELMSIIRALHEVEKSKEVKFGSDFQRICLNIAFDLAAFKNPAFQEEKEVRLVHLLTFKESNDSLRLIDDGGFAFGKEHEGVPVLFQMRDNAPVAFIEIDFTNTGIINPIKEVIVGPKNDGLLSGISVFLETLGIGSVEIKRSKASYR